MFRNCLVALGVLVFASGCGGYADGPSQLEPSPVVPEGDSGSEALPDGKECVPCQADSDCPEFELRPIPKVFCGSARVCIYVARRGC